MRKTIFISILVLICFSVGVFAAGIDSDTKLMLHMDGDDSSSEHTYTANGNPQLDASESQFDGSMYFDGTGDYLSIPDSLYSTAHSFLSAADTSISPS